MLQQGLHEGIWVSEGRDFYEVDVADKFKYKPKSAKGCCSYTKPDSKKYTSLNAKKSDKIECPKIEYPPPRDDCPANKRECPRRHRRPKKKEECPSKKE